MQKTAEKVLKVAKETQKDEITTHIVTQPVPEIAIKNLSVPQASAESDVVITSVANRINSIEIIEPFPQPLGRFLCTVPLILYFLLCVLLANEIISLKKIDDFFDGTYFDAVFGRRDQVFDAVYDFVINRFAPERREFVGEIIVCLTIFSLTYLGFSFCEFLATFHTHEVSLKVPLEVNHRCNCCGEWH